MYMCERDKRSDMERRGSRDAGRWSRDTTWDRDVERWDTDVDRGRDTET